VGRSNDPTNQKWQQELPKIDGAFNNPEWDRPEALELVDD
jgi:hypothetical protein